MVSEIASSDKTESPTSNGPTQSALFDDSYSSTPIGLDSRLESAPLARDNLQSPEKKDDVFSPEFPSENEVSSFFAKLRSELPTADSYLPVMHIDFSNGELEIPPLSDLFKDSKASSFAPSFGADGKQPGDTPAAPRDGQDNKLNPKGDAVPKVENNLAKPEPSTSMDAISKLAEDVLKTPTDVDAFKRDLAGFEKRAELDGLTKKDKEEFYGQVGRVLEESKTGNKNYSSEQLRTIASDMVRQAHQPGLINQGVESTCATAALETVLYIQEPATIARMVADVATTGQYVTSDGTVVKVPERNLHPDKYKAETPHEKQRSLASHIAQPGLINVHWARQDEFFGETGLKGKIVYEEGHPPDFVGDGQSRMMNHSTTPPEPFTTQVSKMDPTANKGVKAPYQVQKPIDGPNMLIDYLPNVYKQLRGNKGDLTIVNYKEGEGVSKAKSAEDFKKIVENAQERKKPILMGVFANRDPFLSELFESYTGKPMTAEERQATLNFHGRHALVGYRYDSKSGDMVIENQWGNRVDHTGQPGQKPKLSVGTVYDTIIDKPKPAVSPSDQKEPQPEDYINSQRRFVELLEKDSDVNPNRTFEERMTLHRYLSHWGHKEEAHKQAEVLSKSMLSRIDDGKGNAKIDQAQQSRLSSDKKAFLSTMETAGENKIIKDVLNATDARFSKIPPSTDQNYLSEFSELLSLHKSHGDPAGATKLADKVVSNAIDTALNNPEDIASRKKQAVVEELSSVLLKNDVTAQVERLYKSQISNLRSYERVHGNTTLAGADARALILFGGREGTFPELKSQMHKEMKENYDALKSKGDLSSEAAQQMRHLLKLQYENRTVKDPDALHSLVQDSIKSLLTSPDGGGPLPTADSEQMITPYVHFADSLSRGGAEKYAVPLMEKALEIAKSKSPDKVKELGYKLVSMLDNANRFDDADKVLKDNKLKEPVNRRRRH